MRITAVSYLNTKPFIYGLYRSDNAPEFELSLDIPSVCAAKLLHGEADIALAPIGILPELDHPEIISDFCIGSTGPVKTVCLFSKVPLEKIERVYLDFHSRTSVALVQVLFREYWKLEPEFIPATKGFESKITGTTAGLVIGDRAFPLLNQFPYIYDLAENWTNWTGLPFVFAAWVSTQPVDLVFLEKFNHSLEFGVDRIPELIKILPNMEGVDLDEYYRKNISYELDEAKREGLQRFLSLIGMQHTSFVQKKIAINL